MVTYRIKMAGKFFFSAQEDEKLVESVGAFPGLYDSEDRDYKDRNIRDNSWEEISGRLQRSTEECKKRWRNIKDTYFKLKRNKNKSGLPSRSKSRWPLLEKLSFLDNIIVKRRIQTIEERRDGDEDSNDNDGNYSPDDSNDCTFQDPLRTTTKRALSLPFNVSKRKRRDSSTNMFEIQEAGSEISGADNIENINWRNEDEDPILLFFKSMAMTVKTFEPQLIPEVKSRVFNVINEFEVKAIQKKYGGGIIEDSNQDKSVTNTPLNIETKYSQCSSFHLS